MADYGHYATDRLISVMQSRIDDIYGKTEEELEKRLNDYLARYKVKDRIKREMLKREEITKEEYNYWRTGQIAIGKRWEEMKKTIAQDLHNSNNLARSMVQGYMPEVYALNHNYGTFQVEKESLLDTSYTLYDRQTVERIMEKDEDLLPLPGPRKKAEIAAGKDIKWQYRQLQSAMTKSILMGDSIPNIAKRLANELSVHNKNSAVRYARTAATSAQNAGRVDSYKRAEGMGIELEQEWMATLDGRTRYEHRMLDGQHIKVGESFKVDGYTIRFPGDPWAPGYLIWNCRCTLVPRLKSLDQSNAPRNSKLGNMTYDEWKYAHTSGFGTDNMFGYTYGQTFDFPIFKDGDVEYVKVAVTRKDNYKFPDGAQNGVHHTGSADVYRLDNGMQIIYPSNIDLTKQSLLPDDTIRQYMEIPKYYRDSMQKTINIVDYRNPQDSYWAKTYNMPGFKSYMVGGDQITVWNSTSHNMDYVTKSFAHEGGHYIDRFKADEVSKSKEWSKAVVDDLKATGFDAPSDYARQTAKNNPGYFVEDFADSCAEFVVNHDFFVANFPNRAKIIKRILKIKD